MFSCVAEPDERRSPAALDERAVAQVHIGKAGERLERKIAERHAVADFAEHLSDIAVQPRFRLIGEAGEENAAARVDVIERI